MALRCIFLTVLIMTFISGTLTQNDTNYRLKQVLVVSRHNIRAPIKDDMLNAVTRKPWPVWMQNLGDLTSKGELLEGFIGEYFASWLHETRLLPGDCPSEDLIRVRANVKQRTIASARALVKKAFPECNITVFHKQNYDPVFNLGILNETDAFKQEVNKEVNDFIIGMQLNDAFKELQEILGYKDSDSCNKFGRCSLVAEETVVDSRIRVGDMLKVFGPLEIGNTAVDTFMMQYYEGWPMEDVAWGLVDGEEKWKKLTRIITTNLNLCFNITRVAQDITRPTLKYLKDIFFNEEEVPKVTLLYGHDATIFALTNVMRFEPYDLPGQIEKAPVGGKIVFQKWYDDENDIDLLKIEYFYLSWDQIRNGAPLNNENRLKIHLLELQDCKVDDKGFCPWMDFVKLLKNL